MPFCVASLSIIGVIDVTSEPLRYARVASRFGRVASVTMFGVVTDRDGGANEPMLTRFDVWLMMFRVDWSILDVVSTVSYFFSFTLKKKFL